MKSLNSDSKFIVKNKPLPYIVLIVGFFLIIPQFASAGLLDSVTNVVANGILAGILAYFFWVPLLFALLFVTISNILLQAAIAFAISGTPYIYSDAVNLGWPIVRDLANMFVVLGFVIVGIAFTLRIESYGSKKVLINLIIATILINFSLLICGIFIDGSNILMRYFFKTNNFWAGWFPEISGLWTILTNLGTDNVLNFAAKIIGLVLFWVAAGLVNILYFFLLLMRVIALWMLVILSPLAFVCYVFPFSRGIFQMWWKNFFQWCIIILPAGLFYHIGSTLIHSSFSKHSELDLANTSTYISYISNAFSIILVPSMFLIAGFLVSLQFSAMGSSVITNFANKHKGTAMKMGLGALTKSAGTLGKITGWAGNKAGGSTTRVGRILCAVSGAANKQQARADVFKGKLEKTRSAFGRGLEGAGAIPVGTRAAKDDKALAEAIKALTAALKSGNKQDQQRVFDKIHNGTGIDRTAAIIAATSEGKLHDAFKNQATGQIDYYRMNDALETAEKSGKAPKNMRKDAEDKYYELAGLGDKGVDAALTTLGHKATIDAALPAGTAGTASPAERMAAARRVLSATDITRAEQKADYIKLKQNWGSMDEEARANTNLGNLHTDDLQEFLLSRTGDDMKVFKMLDAGDVATGRAAHPNREIIRQMAGLMTAGSNVVTPGSVIESAHTAAAGNTNKQRRLKEVLDEARTL